MRRLPPLGWLFLSLLSSLALGVTFFVGIFASGKDTDETCAKAGQILDQSYRQQNWQEPSQIFPLHNKCNANYDMVPIWVNPALIIFAALALTFLIAAAAPALARINNQPKGSSRHDNN